VAEAEFEKGSTDSVEKLRGAIDSARSTDDDFVVAALAMPFSRALLRLGRAAEARDTISSAIAYFRRMDLKPYLANALSVLGDVADALGEREAAAGAREEAASLRDEIKLPPPAAALPQILQA
jgi:hypothetical protein